MSEMMAPSRDELSDDDDEKEVRPFAPVHVNITNATVSKEAIHRWAAVVAVVVVIVLQDFVKVL